MVKLSYFLNLSFIGNKKLFQIFPINLNKLKKYKKMGTKHLKVLDCENYLNLQQHIFFRQNSQSTRIT